MSSSGPQRLRHPLQYSGKFKPFFCSGGHGDPSATSSVFAVFSCSKKLEKRPLLLLAPTHFTTQKRFANACLILNSILFER
jgi:hypothetical protein